MPILLLAGVEDAITPPDDMRAIANRLPVVRFVEIADAEHLPPMENPSATNAALAGFLTGEMGP